MAIRPLVAANPSTVQAVAPQPANTDPRQSITGEALNFLDSGDANHVAMEDFWKQVADIVDGAKAMRDNHAIYLPKFPNETEDDYTFRWKNAKFTNVYRDILENLASKPFEQEVTLVADAKDKADTDATIPQPFLDFIEDVDGSGNNLTGYALDTFFNGINSALDWIFIDYPDVPAGNRTVEQERALGLKPFWTHVLASNVLQVKSKIINGKEQIVYIRIREYEPDGMYIRIIQRDNAGVWWQLYKETKAKPGGTRYRFEVDSVGVLTIPVIPMTPFITGRRKGRTWRFEPMLRDAADTQVELFQDESGLKNIKAVSAFPMLTGNGVKPEMDGKGINAKPKALPTGPRAVLYAPPGTTGTANGTWEYLSPDAAVLKFLQDDIEKTINQLRELGRNPLTAQSGNLTVITTSVAAKKGNSAVQMWAWALKNALENALVITGMWLGIPQTVYDPEVFVFTDFDVEGAESDLPSLLAARKNGDISRETLWHEMSRRGILSGEFDPELEIEKLLEEIITKDETGDGTVDDA